MASDWSIHLAPVLPWWAIALIGVGLSALLVHGSRVLAKKQVPGNWVAALAALRAAIVVVFVGCLLQPVLSYATQVRSLPRLALLIDASQSMGIRPAPGAPTRLEEATAALAKRDMLKELSTRYDLRVFAFDRSARLLQPGDLAKLQASGETTRLGDSLMAAWNESSPGDGMVGERLGAASAGTLGLAGAGRVMLISDGNDLGTQDPVAVARRLGVSIDVVPAGSAAAAESAPRVTIASVQTPRRVLLGSEAQLMVNLRSSGANPGPLTLTLLEGERLLMAQDVMFNPGQTDKQIRLSYKPAETGVRRYEFRVGPKGGAATRPAARASTQSRADAAGGGGDPAAYRFSMQVADQRMEVLLLEDNWRWEFKFLRRVMEDDPSFSMTAMLARGSGSFVQFGEADRKVSLGGFPQSKAELEWFDMIVLGDVKPQRWSRGLASGLAQLVTQEGKSLVVVAGPGLGAIADSPELSALLPVELTSESSKPIEGPVDVRVTPAGVASPFFNNQPTIKETGAQAPLPTLDQVYPPLRKRPAATILLEAPRHSNSFGRIIVAAEHTIGRGRVLFIGTDTLWKWQMLGTQNPAGATAYGMFWQQALRAMAPSRVRGGGVNLWLQPDRSRYEAGARVTLRAELKSDRPLTGATVQGSVLLPDDTQVPLSFAQDPSQPDRFEAEFDTLNPGQHRVSASVMVDGRSTADVLAAFEVEPARSEASATTVDMANLQRIAAGTGGRMIDPGNPDTWPSPAGEPVVRTQRQAIDLWNHFPLLILLCILLGVDWALRLVRGYV